MSSKKSYSINLLKKMDSELIELENYLQSFTDADLKKAPAPGKWSTLQICMHVKLGEELSLKNAAFNVGRLEQRPPAGLVNDLRSIGLQFVLWSPLKFRSPEPVRVDTGHENETLENVFIEWRLLRTNIMDFLQKSPDLAYEREVYKHPRVKYLALHQMIKFLNQHFARHQNQMKGILGIYKHKP